VETFYNELFMAAIALIMVIAGLKKSALELRRSVRSCPACGRDVRVCHCR
jgi:hypothetical protein